MRAVKWVDSLGTTIFRVPHGGSRVVLMRQPTNNKYFERLSDG